MTPRDRRKLAEAVAERVGDLSDPIHMRGESQWEVADGLWLRAWARGEWMVWTRSLRSRRAYRHTGRNWLPRTADAIAEAVRAAAPPQSSPVTSSSVTTRRHT